MVGPVPPVEREVHQDKSQKDFHLGLADSQVQEAEVLAWGPERHGQTHWTHHQMANGHNSGR